MNKTFPQYLIQNFLLDKKEKSFWGKEFIRLGILTNQCSFFYMQCSLLGELYSSIWKDLLNAFGIPSGQEDEIYLITKKQLSQKFVPFAKNSTFFEILLRNIQESIKIPNFQSPPDLTSFMNQKFPYKESLQFAGINCLEGVFAGIIYPEQSKDAYQNTANQQTTIDKLSETSNTNLREEFDLAGYEFPNYESFQNDTNELFLEFASENLSDELTDKFNTITFDKIYNKDSEN